MASISAPLLVAALAVSAIFRPLRNTVTVSDTSKMSSMKCEMKTIAVPSSRRRRSVANSRSTSGGERAEVGSSRMTMRAPENSTRAISISCWSPIGRSPSRLIGSTSMPKRASCSPASRAMRRHCTRPRALVGWLPRKTFSATVRSGATESSWCTMAMPAACASRVERKWVSFPSSRKRPENSVCTPAMIFISVLFPAPFSPTRPWISPG